MEHKTTQDENENRTSNEEAESRMQKPGAKEDSRVVSGCAESLLQWKRGEGIRQDSPHRRTDASGEVNMEASIIPDDVIRAGGFGARDDISSFLPSASDSTDFEATILDARDYEEPQAEVRRAGLGWKEVTKKE